MQKFQSAPGASASASPSAAGVKKSGAGNGPAFEDFWQAPSRYWKRELDDWEIDLVQVRASPDVGQMR